MDLFLISPAGPSRESNRVRHDSMNVKSEDQDPDKQLKLLVSSMAGLKRKVDYLFIMVKFDMVRIRTKSKLKVNYRNHTLLMV
jgi:hypothetical protein